MGEFLHPRVEVGRHIHGIHHRTTKDSKTTHFHHGGGRQAEKGSALHTY